MILSILSPAKKGKIIIHILESLSRVPLLLMASIFNLTPRSPTQMLSMKLSSCENSKPCVSLKVVNSSLFKYPLASKIMVKNLPYSTSENNLQKEFSRFGEIAEVKLVTDKVTKTSKGYAFIQYTSQEDALLALDSMDQKYFNGRMIFIEIAKPRKTDFGQYPKTCGPTEEQRVLSEYEGGNEEGNANKIGTC